MSLYAQVNCNLLFLMNYLFLKLCQSVLVKGGGSQFHSRISGKVTGREEMMTGKLIFEADLLCFSV